MDPSRPTDLSPQPTTSAAERSPADDVTTLAADYLTRGFQPIPFSAGTKNPNRRGWPNERRSAADLGDFTSGDNIGLLCGGPSGDLTDADLDCQEALDLADSFLPPTGMVHGRASALGSHRWYVAPGVSNRSFKDLDDSVLVELRSTGLQTIVPPSVADGEQRQWEPGPGPGDPAHVEGADLERQVRRLAAAALLVRHYPGQGSRNEFALALGGALVRGGWSTADVEHFINAVAVAAKDEEAASRSASVGRTSNRLEEDQPTTGCGKLKELLGDRVVKRLQDFLPELKVRAVPGQTSKPGGADEKQSSKATRCIGYALAEKPEIFRSSDGRAFVKLPSGRTVSVAGKDFCAWIRRLAWEAESSALSEQQLSEVIGHFEGVALHDACERDVFVRLGHTEDKIFLDLGDESLAVVEISASGWQVLPSSPVAFVRPSGFQALPVPVRGGRLDELRNFLNLGEGPDGDELWALISSWLVSTLHPNGPYPILGLRGEQGSGKSGCARYLRAIVDPNTAPVRSPPREDRDLCIVASNNWIVGLDNLSKVPEWLSNGLCCVATGGGLSIRALYTDRDEAIFTFKRPILFTAIDLGLRSDLLDRTILATLPKIPDASRREEAEMDSLFHAALPRILGGLLDGAVTALRRHHEVVLVSPPRMVDSARWAVAAEPALGVAEGAIEAALARNRSTAAELVLNASPIVPPLLRLELPWSGTATDLLSVLARGFAATGGLPKGWPTNGQALSCALRLIAPDLRRKGIDIDFPDGKRRDLGRQLRITRTSAPGAMSAPDSEKGLAMPTAAALPIAQVATKEPTAPKASIWEHFGTGAGASGVPTRPTSSDPVSPFLVSQSKSHNVFERIKGAASTIPNSHDQGELQ